MATKSLYETEDVCATLMYALEHQNHTLVIQAARELRVSGELDLLVNLVVMAWLLCDPRSMPMTCVPTHATVFDDLCRIMNHFPPTLPKHTSQVALPLPPTIEQAQEAITFCISNKFWKPCFRMLTTFLHKDTPLLHTILRDQCDIDPPMLEVLDRIVYQPLAERLLYHIVIQRLGLARASTSPLANQARFAAIWNTTTHGRAARTFHIPLDALSAWNIRPKSHERLQGTLIPRAIMDKTSRSLYWESANPPPSEDDIESWFAEHFPDDIPDEWSRAEIEKSHVYAPPLAIRNTTNDWHPAFLLCWS